MTDKEKMNIFKSIENFDFFVEQANKQKNIFISDNINIKFDREFRTIFLDDKVIQLNIPQFLNFLKELFEEKNN